MQRQPHVLSWTLLRNSCRVESTQTISQNHQRIISSATKELPNWAFAYSSRRIHTSAVKSKPKDESTLNSVGINWESGSEGENSSDSYIQVLLEWKAMQNRLKGKTSQIHFPVIEWTTPQQAPRYLPSPDFFIPNTPDVAMTHEEKTPKAITLSNSKQRTSNIAIQNRLWLTDLDNRVLKESSRLAMSQIRDGERNIDRLAKIFLRNLETSAAEVSGELTLWEQARLFVFSDWVTKATNALNSNRLHVQAVALCFNVTADLYHSMKEKDNQLSTVKTYGFSGIRQATLHRLFSLLYPYTRLQRKRSSNNVALLVCQTLTLISTLLRDDGMRPTQARYLCHMYLSRLEQMAMVKSDTCSQELLWSEAATTFMVLINRGILVSPAIGTHLSKSSSNVDTFLRLLCLALAKGHIKYTWAKTTIIDLARASQVVHFQGKTLARGDRSIDRTSIEKALEVNQAVSLTLDPFASQSTLEDMVGLLCRSGRYNLAREIAFMAPRQQRSLRVLSFLMHRWSSVLPDMTIEDCKKREQSTRLRRGSFHTCNISQRLWTEAMSLVDVDDKANFPALIDIFNARMAFHARSRAPRLVAADLKALQKVQGEERPLSDLLGLLKGQAQVEIVRAHTRSASLAKAKEWAHKIVLAFKIRLDAGNVKESDKYLPLQIMNVLLSAYIKSKGNKKMLTARHKFSMLLRQGGAIKKRRIYLRRTVNCYFKAKKEEILPHYLRAKSTNRYRFMQAFDYLVSFANRHGIVPDERTTKMLLIAILRMNPRKVSLEILHRIKEQADFDWKAKGVSGVFDECKVLLAGGDVVPTVYPLSTKEGARRAQMIDAAVEKREWRQYFGQRGTRI